MKKQLEAQLGEFMSFTNKGFSWAEVICQRVESICLENKMVQSPGKYVNSVGEHFKSMFDNFCETADDVLEMFDLSLGNAALVKKSGNIGEELDDSILDEKPSAACAAGKVASTLKESSSMEHINVTNTLENQVSGSKKDASDDILLTSNKFDKDVLYKEDSLADPGNKTEFSYNSRVAKEDNTSDKNCACDKLESEVDLVEDLNQSKSTSDHWFLDEKDSSTAIDVKVSMAETSELKCSSLTFPDAAASDISCTNSLDAGLSMSNVVIITSEPSPIQSIGMLETESQGVESNGSKIVRQNECENLINVNGEELTDSSFIRLKTEDISKYAEIKVENELQTEALENEWDDIVKQEIDLISSRVFRKESCKVKFRKMFTSRWRSSRGRELINHQDDLQSKTSLESGWELV
ncbi:hypothetical protein HPP92_019600 [Vanilla planifolia]|uniref:Uncharacterized protein n=1 Tax=Vanilla planifolia TaxID=51239 RepID=A0A835Q780_VANPL|nr:hypothetical protein HPP92_020024 [Vanilla planifolia]KAG0465436.1 hypothetical protein HPP92_019600 [Vanilla planifolia]